MPENNSTCELTLTGDIGTMIASGICEDEAGYKWDLPADLTFKTEIITAVATCETLGAIEAAKNTITKINTPQKGWISVTNEVPATVGAAIETDEQLRQRQSLSVAIPGQNMLNSTIAGIAAIIGVTRYKVYDNDTNMTDDNGIPAHSIAAVVEGGSDEDIAEQIYLRKGPGGGTYGSVSVNYTNDDGLPNTVRFSRPIYVDIDVNVSIRANAGYTTSVNDDIKSSVENYITNLDIGYDVTIMGILTAITSVVKNMAIPEFSVQTITLSRDEQLAASNDIDIAFNEVAAVGKITVFEVM